MAAWTPKKDDLYFFWDRMGRLQSRFNWNAPSDLENFKVGNCFKSERQAQKKMGSGGGHRKAKKKHRPIDDVRYER